MMIDPHVHCRDGRQAYKTTIRRVLEIAAQSGVGAIFDMPNTDPSVLFAKDVEERLRLVPKDGRGCYFLYVGLTGDPEQVRKAVRCWRDFTEVVGLKLYAGESVGNLAVSDPDAQECVYRTLAEEGYDGVLAVHCEKEALFVRDAWQPSYPPSHGIARPKSAETESVRDQIALASETGFRGVLHICHISAPEAVEAVDVARAHLRITCGVTPHHLLWSDERLLGQNGLLYKVNPPLRHADDVARLREQLKEGKIDWIESDHAPHRLSEKLHAPYLSGYPSLFLYRGFVTQFLPSLGLQQERIRALTRDNILRAFGAKTAGIS